jgi:hypothetical protein
MNFLYLQGCLKKTGEDNIVTFKETYCLCEIICPLPFDDTCEILF